MQLKMAENSLFAVLLRSSWWISLAVAAGVVVVSRAVLPDAYWLYGAFGALPFVVIAAIAARRQLSGPSAARIAAAETAARAMSAAEFEAALASALRADGYAVGPANRPGADLEITRAGRVTLLACRRWKAARTGVEPLRELQAAIAAHDAHDGLYVALGEVTDSARAFAARHAIRLVNGSQLAQWMR